MKATKAASMAIDEGSARSKGTRLAEGEVTDWLRDSIVEGDLPSGARLSEVSIGKEFGVSRTPVREALRVLASEGLVDWQPNRSAVVKQVSNASVIEALDLLGALETLAVRLVTERVDDAQLARLEAAYEQHRRESLDPTLQKHFGINMHLHFALVEASDNPMLARFHRIVATHLVRARHMINITGRHLDSSIRDHRRIMNAVFARDAAAARRAVAVHIGHMKRDLVIDEAVAPKPKQKPASRPPAKRRKVAVKSKKSK